MILMAYVLAPSGCAMVPGSYEVLKCTLVFETTKMVVTQEGPFIIDQEDVTSLTCNQTWASPKE